MMSNQHSRPFICITILFAAIALTSCGSSGVGSIPSGTPSLGKGTLAVIPSPSPTRQGIPSASPAALDGTYAFVRNNQLWLALHGAKPVQATSFDYANLPDVSWHQPVWSSGDGFVAFIMNARPAGQGGGGCPAPDYGEWRVKCVEHQHVAADAGDSVSR